MLSGSQRASGLGLSGGRDPDHLPISGRGWTISHQQGLGGWHRQLDPKPGPGVIPLERAAGQATGSALATPPHQERIEGGHRRQGQQVLEGRRPELTRPSFGRGRGHPRQSRMRIRLIIGAGRCKSPGPAGAGAGRDPDLAEPRVRADHPARPPRPAPHQEYRRGDGRASKYPALPAFTCLPLKVPRRSRCNARAVTLTSDENTKNDAVVAALHAAAVRDDSGGHAERDDVGEQIEFTPPEPKTPGATARDATVSTSKTRVHQHQRAGKQDVDGVAALQGRT